MPYCVGGLIKLHLLQCQLYPFVKGNGDELVFKKGNFFGYWTTLKMVHYRKHNHFYILTQKNHLI